MKENFFKIVEDRIEFIKENMVEINSENYYSSEANRQYMNSTQYKNWIECEAKELAIQKGEWEDGEKLAFVLGNYLHSWNDGTMQEYLRDNKKALFTNNGKKRATTQDIDRIINRFENDKFINFLLKDENSQKEPIFISKFAGVWWKIRIDDLNLDFNRIIDLKTSADIYKKFWNNDKKKYETFIEAFKYPLQMAIYEKIARQALNKEEPFEVLLVVGTKQKSPDKMVINMTDAQRFEEELMLVEANMEHILRVKYGLIEPIRCEKCDYCKATKQLEGLVNYKDIKI